MCLSREDDDLAVAVCRKSPGTQHGSTVLGNMKDTLLLAIV